MVQHPWEIKLSPFPFCRTFQSLEYVLCIVNPQEHHRWGRYHFLTFCEQESLFCRSSHRANVPLNILWLGRFGISEVFKDKNCFLDPPLQKQNKITRKQHHDFHLVYSHKGTLPNKFSFCLSAMVLILGITWATIPSLPQGVEEHLGWCRQKGGGGAQSLTWSPYSSTLDECSFNPIVWNCSLYAFFFFKWKFT